MKLLVLFYSRCAAQIACLFQVHEFVWIEHFSVSEHLDFLHATNKKIQLSHKKLVKQIKKVTMGPTDGQKCPIFWDILSHILEGENGTFEGL